jgi:uncharacterized protein (TIGR00269 family)
MGEGKGACRCGRKAVYFRRNEKTLYCSQCFCKSVEKKFRKTVGKYGLVRPGDRIALALSGGKDSSVALHLMHNLVRPRRDVNLFAISVDEGIPRYRAPTIRTAGRLCRKLGVKHYVFSFKDVFGRKLESRAGKGGKDLCTFCGVGRRYILNMAARKLRATKLCVGHNLDDEAQSVLMNYMRGDLLRAGRMGVVTDEAVREGAGGFIPRIKPLRFIPEREIALYAVLRKVPFSELECPYISGMRPEVRDFLNEMEWKHPGTKFSVVESYDRIAPRIRSAVRYRGVLARCAKCGEPSSHEICKTCQLWKAQV